MKTQTAVDILVRQKEKLQTDNLTDGTWLTYTSSFIKDFFGETSQEYNFINNFKFHRNSISAYYDLIADVNKNRIVASKFLDECIEIINHKGLHKSPKQNFINRLSDTALWTLIPLCLAVIWGFGFTVGLFTSDVKNFDLRQENKLLKDSLSDIRASSISTDKISNSRPNAVHNKTITNKTPK